jgi:hypothetical protein
MKEEFPVGQPADVEDFKNLPEGTSKNLCLIRGAKIHRSQAKSKEHNR